MRTRLLRQAIGCFGVICFLALLTPFQITVSGQDPAERERANSSDTLPTLGMEQGFLTFDTPDSPPYPCSGLPNRSGPSAHRVRRIRLHPR